MSNLIIPHKNYESDSSSSSDSDDDSKDIPIPVKTKPSIPPTNLKPESDSDSDADAPLAPIKPKSTVTPPTAPIEADTDSEMEIETPSKNKTIPSKAATTKAKGSTTTTTTSSSKAKPAASTNASASTSTSSATKPKLPTMEVINTFKEGVKRLFYGEEKLLDHAIRLQFFCKWLNIDQNQIKGMNITHTESATTASTSTEDSASSGGKKNLDFGPYKVLFPQKNDRANLDISRGRKVIVSFQGSEYVGKLVHVAPPVPGITFKNDTDMKNDEQRKKLCLANISYQRIDQVYKTVSKKGNEEYVNWEDIPNQAVWDLNNMTDEQRQHFTNKKNDVFHWAIYQNIVPKTDGSEICIMWAPSTSHIQELVKLSHFELVVSPTDVSGKERKPLIDVNAEFKENVGKWIGIAILRNRYTVEFGKKMYGLPVLPDRFLTTPKYNSGMSHEVSAEEIKIFKQLITAMIKVNLPDSETTNGYEHLRACIIDIIGQDKLDKYIKQVQEEKTSASATTEAPTKTDKVEAPTKTEAPKDTKKKASKETKETKEPKETKETKEPNGHEAMDTTTTTTTTTTDVITTSTKRAAEEAPSTKAKKSKKNNDPVAIVPEAIASTTATNESFPMKPEYKEVFILINKAIQEIQSNKYSICCETDTYKTDNIPFEKLSLSDIAILLQQLASTPEFAPLKKALSKFSEYKSYEQWISQVPKTIVVHSFIPLIILQMQEHKKIYVQHQHLYQQKENMDESD